MPWYADVWKAADDPVQRFIPLCLTVKPKHLGNTPPLSPRVKWQGESVYIYEPALARAEAHAAHHNEWHEGQPVGKPPCGPGCPERVVTWRDHTATAVVTLVVLVVIPLLLGFVLYGTGLIHPSSNNSDCAPKPVCIESTR